MVSLGHVRTHEVSDHSSQLLLHKTSYYYVRKSEPVKLPLILYPMHGRTVNQQLRSVLTQIK